MNLHPQLNLQSGPAQQFQSRTKVVVQRGSQTRLCSNDFLISEGARLIDSRSRGVHKRVAGQGLTEYIIIIAIIAIAAIGATSFFGDSIKASFLALGSELTGSTKVGQSQARHQHSNNLT